MKATRGLLGGVGAGMLALVAGAAPLAGQIVTDRPDFTESTYTVPDGHFQLEAGYTYATAGELSGHQIGEALIRLGLIPGLELRALLPSFNSVSGDVGPVEFEESGWSDAGIGMKLGLYESGMSEGLPSVSLLFGSSIPVGDDDFGADGWEPEAILALGWALAPRLDLGANVKYTQRDPDFGDRYNEWAASIALGLPVTSSLGAFIEYFGIRPDLDGLEDDDYIDGGITYLFSDTFQLDARVGFNLEGDDDEMFFGVGFGKLF